MMQLKQLLMKLIWNHKKKMIEWKYQKNNNIRKFEFRKNKKTYSYRYMDVLILIDYLKNEIESGFILKQSIEQHLEVLEFGFD